MTADFTAQLNDASLIHFAIKDVTNNGLPNLLIALNTLDFTASLGVFGFANGHITLVDVLEGQQRMLIHEGGRISMPYGSGRYEH